MDSAPHAILLAVAYDGSDFHGYAIQSNARTVAGELLGAIRAMDPHVRDLRGVSRTDAGVHARGQLVAFDTAATIPPRGWLLGLHAHLPPEIAPRRAAIVSVGFDARRHVLHKHYRYTILEDPLRDPFVDRFAWRIGAPLDLDRALCGARDAVGTHDFAAFRSSADERTSTVRTMLEMSITRGPIGSRLIFIDVVGTAFLHNMVRIVVGTLIDIARGRLDPGVIRKAIVSGDRSDLGITAPPQGLCLMSVTLGDTAQLREDWPPNV